MKKILLPIFSSVLLTSSARLIDLLIGLIPPVVNEMVHADRGWGVKWKFACYVWPKGFSPE